MLFNRDNKTAELRIATIFGARPQFIKAAAVSRAVERHNEKNTNPTIFEILVHTGQHYDGNMSQIFFDQLGIPQPKYHLEVGSGDHGQMTGAMLTKIETVLMKERPDWVLVYGDTNSTLAGALASVKLHIPVAHVEAGLRSDNRLMPEEINRVVTDHISSILFCPTDAAIGNLEKEGITKGVIKVGDVMYDAFLTFKELIFKKTNILSDLGLKTKKYCLATVHRQENTDDPKRLSNIITAFTELATTECPLIVSLHPRTTEALQRHNITFPADNNVQLIPPVSYIDMIALESNARIILTDSGGMQKEAYFAKVPCVTLRDETEWVETVKAGWNHLAGADTQNIAKAFQTATDSIPNEPPELYGNGKASELIVKHLIATMNN